MYMPTRQQELEFLKRLWSSQPTSCPKCGLGPLKLLHKKAKKSSCDWVCPSCREIYRTIRMLKDLPNE